MFAIIHPSAYAEVIYVDNGSVDFTLTGTWNTRSSTSGYYVSAIHYTGAGTGEKTATWTPLITNTSTYEVFARWINYFNYNATNAKYTINHASGPTIVEVNQRNNANQWYSLGTYTFNSGQSGNIVLTNDANGQVYQVNRPQQVH